MKKPIRLLVAAFLSIVATASSAQTCDCTDCPVDDQAMQFVTSVIDVTGLTNSTLNEGGQGICEISLEFSHDWISDLEIVLVAPNGSSISLLLDNSSVGPSTNSTWDITFLPCADPVSPDPGASDSFNGADFIGDTDYTGSYHPGNGCFSDLTGSANGEWTLEFTSLIAGELDEITNWSITFCDGDGLDCSPFTCESNMGTFSNDTQTFCDTDDPLEAAPIVTGGNNTSEYTTTWVILSNVGGSTGEILGYSETADFTGYPPGDYFICGLNYLTSDFSQLPATNAGNTNASITDLINDDTICAVFGFACAEVIIEDCGCTAEAGNIFISNLSYCVTDAINLNPTVSNENTDADYGYTFTVSNYTSGSIGTLAGYTETGDLTGYAEGQYWVCGLSILLTDEPLLPTVNGSNSNLDIQDDILNETICAELAAGCYVINIEGEATQPILDYETEICVGETSSLTITNYDPSGDWGVIINSGSFSMISTGFPTTTFTPQTDQDIEICVVNLSICGDIQTCATIVVNESSAGNLMIEGPTVLCPGNLINYTLSGLGSSTIDTWTISGDASIVGSTTNDNVDVQFDNIATTGSVELCIDVTDDCDATIQECITIDVVDNELENATFPDFCEFDFFVEVLIDGTFGVGVWTVVSAPGNVTFDDVNNSFTDVSVDATGDYILQFTYQCNQSIDVEFSVFDPLMVENVTIVCAGTMYTISFDITGGDSPYFVDGTIVTGSNFMSGLIDDDPYNFMISDAIGCTPFDLTGDPDCSCDSDAGSISPQDILTSCEDETVTATGNGDSFLDGDDIGIWILYSDSGDPLGSIILENTTGDFSFVAPLNYSTTYFIAYVVGNDIGGTVDLLDPCINVADGTSIIFSEPFGLTGVTVDPLNSCGTEYELTAIQDSPIDGQWVFTIIPAGGSGTFSNTNGLSTIITLEGEGLFTVQYSTTDGLCSVSNNVVINGPEIPVATLLSSDCAADNSTYQVTIDISGGTGPFSEGGTPFSGSVFTSGDINSGESYSFIFTDSDGCISEEINGTFFCDCDSNPGNMSEEIIEICGDGNATIINDGTEFLDGNDALIYILHTVSGSSLGTILDENQTGDFSFLPSMIYGVTYYVSAVVGDEDGTSVDLSDDCLNVANGQPVIWYEEIIINSLISDNNIGCDDFNITIDANTTVQGMWNVISSPTGSTVDFSTTDNVTTVSVNLVGAYSLQYVITNGACTVMEEISITLSEVPTISNVTYDCDDANENYQVSFDITGGTPPYTVNGTAITGSTFTSDITPNGMSMDYAVTDVNGCTSESITTNNDCSVDCTSDAGSMPQFIIETCYDTVGTQPIIQVISDGNITLDSDDDGVYILHFGDDNTIMSPIAESATGTFQNIGIVPYNTPLYISFVVGNGLNGSVDLSDPCLSVSIGQPIIFYQAPRVFIGDDLTTCGLEINLIASQITGNDISTIWSNPSGPIGGNMTIIQNTIDDVNLVVDIPGIYTVVLSATNDLNANCIASDTVEITFYDIPTVNVMDGFSSCLSTIELQSVKSGGTGVWSIPNLPEIEFDSIPDTTSIALDTFGIFEIIRTVIDNGCIAVDTLTVEIFPTSEFIITGYNCDITNENYTLTYEIIGDNYPYTINGESINQGETANLNTTSGNSINILVLDNNLCEIYNNDITRDCDCENELGPNPQEIYSRCISDILIVLPPTSFTLSEGDSLIYVMHSSDNSTIDNIVATSSDGIFVFDPLTMNTTEEYFVSAVIYSGGLFDMSSLGDPCTITNIGNPIIWYGPSQTTLIGTTIDACQGDLISIPLEHIGNVPITIGISTSTDIDFEIDITTEGITNVEIPMAESGTVSISYVTPVLFCDNTFSGTTIVNITDSPVLVVQENSNVCSDINSGNTLLNLSDLVITSSGLGSWTDSDGNQITDTEINFSGVADGSYLYFYTLDDNGCGFATASTLVTVTSCTNCPTDVIIALPEFCEGTFTVDLNEFVSSAFSELGTWAQVEGMNITPLSDPIITIVEGYFGSEEYAYIINGLPSDCDSIFSNTLTVIESPNAGASSGAINSFCIEEDLNNSLFDLITDYDTGGTWSSLTTDQFDSTSGEYNVQDLSSGTYDFIYTVDSNSSCPSDAISVLLEIVESGTVEFVITNPLCFNGNDGSVSILDSNGNPISSSYQIIDSEGNEVLDQDSLSAGMYTFSGEGNNGCLIDSTFVLDDPIELFLDLGLDIVLNEGDTATIFSTTNITEGNIDLYEWLANQSEIDAPTYESLILNPDNETVVELSIIDDDGCIVADDILLTVLSQEIPEVEVVLPNIFNANKSEFGVESFSKIMSVSSFAIYDRWGNNVFLAEDYDPAVSNQKWDGSYKGSNAIIGVYVYILQYIDIQGGINQVSGDITLMR